MMLLFNSFRLTINVVAEALLGEKAEERSNFEINILIFSFPFRCRQILDNKESLNAAELEVFWKQLQQIISRSNNNNNHFTPSHIASCISGGIAVLIHFHRSWLSENPDREQWCLEYLRDIVLKPPQPEQFDLPKSIGSDHWDCFIAEALPLIWAEDKDNQEIRCLIALMVFARHYSAVNILFSRCNELRSIFLEDFTMLRRLLFEWAFVRNRLEYVNNFRDKLDQPLIQQFFNNFDRWKKSSFQTFVEGNMTSKIESWKLMDKPKLFRTIDKAIPNWRKQYYLDFELIQAGHTWLPTLEKVTNPEERCDILLFWREALAYVIRRVSNPCQKNRWEGDNLCPYDYEQWVLKNIAVTIQYILPHEQPETLWQPIIDLPKDAHYWSEIFLQEFHIYGLKQNIIPPSYISITRTIINYVLPSETDSHKWPYYEEVWDALLGFEQFSVDYWDKRHSVLIKEMTELVEHWVHHVPIDDRRLTRLSRWLKKTVAESIRLQGLIWIKKIIERSGDYRILKEQSVTDSIASLLNIVWHSNQKQLRQDQSSFETFQYLLSLLTERQNKIALELAEIISS